MFAYLFFFIYLIFFIYFSYNKCVDGLEFALYAEILRDQASLLCILDGFQT